MTQGEDQGRDFADMIGVEVTDDEMIDGTPGQPGPGQSLKRASTTIDHDPGCVVLNPVACRRSIGIGHDGARPHCNEPHAASGHRPAGVVAEFDAYNLGNAGLFHGHAVNPVGSFDRHRVVRDDDELHILLELLKHGNEP